MAATSLSVTSRTMGVPILNSFRITAAPGPDTVNVAEA